MAATYIAQLFQRVFFPTTRGADYLSILVPLFLAAAAKFAGLSVSSDTTVDILAYLGAFTVAMFALRLFVTGPYSMWREQCQDAASLRLELSKPERLVIERLVKHRARARAKLAAALEDLQVYAFAEKWEGFAKTGSANDMARIRRLQAEAGLSEAFEAGRMQLQLHIRQEAEKPSTGSPEDTANSARVLKLLQRHLLGDLTAEALALQLPPCTGSETPQ